MLNGKLCVAAKRTLLFSSASGVWGTLGVIIGEQICDMSLWDDVQLIQLFVAGGVGNTLLALPAGAWNALIHCDSTENEAYENGNLEKKSLVWATLVGGVGSLAGASILCMVDSNAKAISATSVGMVGGLALGFCSLCIGGIYYVITSCRSGELTFSRLSVEAPEVTEDESPRMPLLRGIEALDPEHALIQAPLPSVAEASHIIETRLGVSVEEPVITEGKVQDSDLVDVDLNSSPSVSPIRVSDSFSKKCSLM